MKKLLLFLAPSLMMGVLAVIFMVAPAPTPVLAQGAASCSYVQPNGEITGALSLSLEECAKAVITEARNSGSSDGYGIYDKYILHVFSNGEVYAAIDPGGNVQLEGLDWQFLGSITVTAPTAPQPQVQTQPQTQTNSGNRGTTGQTTSSAPTSLEEIFNVVAEDINDFWSLTFKGYGYNYTRPRITLFDRPQISTGCGTAPAQVGPFYCNIDHGMYFPYGFMNEQYRRIGDYAVVTIIAHEWGHSVQNLLGALDAGDYTINIEQQADCFAGAYTLYASTESQYIRLDQQDIEEGATSLFNAGDPDGTPWWDSRAHGDGELRMEAFMDGFKGGVSAC
jgi:uncharacterized protein